MPCAHARRGGARPGGASAPSAGQLPAGVRLVLTLRRQLPERCADHRARRPRR
ncbi:MAG: hypothetical protein MZW92_23590 [Comamonadaceae bacterium]|nr:hypothetical protein [Comamonadaceae bacterium]